ncbi:MAG: transporter substrate-binding domain-containing protein [Clostridia bacterium]|nr:transporter substrate-binding domain-containing protein [Clostridia bacterium]
MKKKFMALTAAGIAAACAVSLTACSDSDTIYVDTNAYFAPFEYYDSNLNIAGADVDIMNMVGKKLGKKVVFENTDFDAIIPNVAQENNKYDCGAAGITITDARKEQVDFSKPYFTSVQYVICSSTDEIAHATSTDGKNAEYVLWSELAGKKIGYQRDTTGDIYVNLEIDGEKGETPEDDYIGALQGSNAVGVPYDNAQLAVDAIGADQVDVVVVDKLPAEYIVGKNTNYKCYALYYDSETATEEEYAIAVHKGNTELLNAINAVLDELGEEGVNTLVSYHFLVS